VILIGTIHAIRRGTGQPIDDALMNFSWWGYIVVATMYTVVVFRGDLSREGPLIVTKENARTPVAIFLIHSAFLALLLWAAWAAPFILPLLPYWMTGRIHTRAIDLTFADILFILATLLMHKIERRWLYVDSEKVVYSHENGARRS